MSVLDRIRRFVAGTPARDSQDHGDRRRVRSSGPSAQQLATTANKLRGPSAMFFEAARNSPDRTPIPFSSVALRRALGSLWSESAERELVAGLGRWVVDNNGMAFYVLDLVANYSAPVIPRAASVDPEWNKQSEILFDEWALNCDFSRRFDFDTLQRLLSFSVDVDGDAAVSMPLVDGVPLIRSWPCWRIGSPLAPKAGGSYEGVIVDANERVLGYDVTEGQDKVQRYSVDEMLLLYDPDRFERLRGVSALRRGLNDLRDAHDIKGFEKLATKIESALAAVIEGDGGLESDWEGGMEDGATTGDTGGGTSGGDAEGEEGGKPDESPVTVANLLGGDIPTITGTLKQLQSNRPGTNKVDFMESLAGYFVAGLGIPPAFFLDVKLTGPNQRAVIGKAQRKFNRRKAVLARFARWVWVRHTAWRIANGELKAVDGWQRTTFQFPPIATIDLGDQLAAEHEALSKGFITRQTFHGDRARDWQNNEDQVFAEDEYVILKAKAQAERHGLPVELILARHAFERPKQASPQGGGDDAAGTDATPAKPEK